MNITEYKQLIAKPKRSKYIAIPTTAADGTRCPSKKHAKFHNALLQAQQMGVVKYFIREVSFDLPGGVKHRIDYLIFFTDGEHKYYEVKGRDLALGKMKRQQVEEIYNIEVEVV